MASFIERLRAEMLARVASIPGAVGEPLEARGLTTDERDLPRVWAWIESDRVSSRTKPDEDDDPSRVVEIHEVSLAVGVLAKNSTAAADVDAMVREIRERFFPRFEGHDFLLQGVDWEDQLRAFARPFVSASVELTINYIAPDDDAG